MPQRIILTGATGMVGEGVLLPLLQQPSVKAVLSVSRRPVGEALLAAYFLAGLAANLYYAVGVRSEQIGARLQAAGFTHVRNLYGGLFEWVNEGQPVFTVDNQPTDRVHAYSPTWGIWLQRGQRVY